MAAAAFPILGSSQQAILLRTATGTARTLRPKMYFATGRLKGWPMSDVTEDKNNTDAKPKKYERMSDPECYLEIVTGESDRQRRNVFARQDIDLHLRLRKLFATATSLSEKEAIEASQYSSTSRRLRRLGKGEKNDDAPYSPEISHINITFEAEIASNDDIVFGLISEDGPSDYKGRVAIEIRMGPEEHSEITHYDSDASSVQALYICIYLTPQRLQWLHQERLARPNLIPVLRATVSAFKQHRDWGFDRRTKVFLEPDSSAKIVRASFSLSDANPQQQVPEILSNDSLVQEYKHWISALKKQVTEGGGKEEWQRCAQTYDDVGYSVAQWCAANNKSPKETKAHLANAERFLRKLDETIHDKDYTSEKGRAIWQHVHNFKSFIQSIKPNRRDEFGEDSRFSEALDEYIHRSSLQSDHLDWLMLDLLLIVQCSSVYHAYMQLAHGAGFVLFGGVRWKMFLWKLFMRPIGFVAGWILPAVGFYYLARWSEGLGVGLAVLYYGASVGMLLYGIWLRIVAMLNSMPNPKRVLLNRINQFDKIYPLLAAPTMHLETFRRAFDHAQDNGANFDQRLFYILDRVHARSPHMWRTGTRGGYYQHFSYEDEQ